MGISYTTVRERVLSDCQIEIALRSASISQQINKLYQRKLLCIDKLHRTHRIFRLWSKDKKRLYFLQKRKIYK
jgi:uncharacterized membrane protein